MKTPKCKGCGMSGHYKINCLTTARTVTKQAKPLKRSGRIAKAWIETRKAWLKDHPQDIFICYLCNLPVPRTEMTLDHVLPRSRRPDLRFEASNLRPVHFSCNFKKGSRVLETAIKD